MRIRAALRLLVALVPAVALTAALPWANRLEPRVLGLPFLLFWILAWVLATPLFLAVVYALSERAPQPEPPPGESGSPAAGAGR
jgi:hypothetical protein